MSAVEFSKWYAEAREAGLKAGNAAEPVPMVVSEADVLSGQPKAGGKSWYVSEGACGFAWINVRPGNSSFANWLKKNGKARSNSYEGGVQIWVGEFNQSVARKEAYAYAFAEVLRGKGVKAYAGSRLD